MNKRLLLIVRLAACGMFFAAQAVTLRVCNETKDEDLYITVYWRMPGKTGMDFLTRESSATGKTFLSSKCRIFGPVPEISSVAWFTKSQWNRLPKDAQKILKDSSKVSGDATSYKVKSRNIVWYKLDLSGFGADNIRQLSLSKDKKGTVFVKEDTTLSEVVSKKLSRDTDED